MTPPHRPASTASVPEPVELSLRKKLLFCSVLGALVVLAGVVAEGLLRLAMPELKYAYAAPIDPETGYGVTLGHRFSLNSLGIREAEFPALRPPGQTRVLCLGDSITFCYGLPYESAWPKLLETRLRQRYAGRRHILYQRRGQRRHDPPGAGVVPRDGAGFRSGNRSSRFLYE